jgi:hypothetical protein
MSQGTDQAGTKMGEEGCIKRGQPPVLRTLLQPTLISVLDISMCADHVILEGSVAFEFLQFGLIG